MEDWVDTITFGNVAQVKTVLATVVLCLAVYQVMLMSVGYNVLKPPFLKPKAASFAHRAVGDTIVPIALLIAWMCVSYFEVGDGIEHAAYGETTRAAIHVMAGSAFVGVLADQGGHRAMVPPAPSLPPPPRDRRAAPVRGHLGELGR